MHRILVLGTGGTIAGHAASDVSASYKSGKIGIADLLPDLPEAEFDVCIASDQVANIGSQDMDAGVWRALHARIAGAFSADEADAIVVAHGTDTLEETGFWLDLTLPGRRPVILTGAMRPANAIGSDGPRNLACALRVATDPASRDRGVLCVMGDSVFQASDVYKSATEGAQAFRSYPRGRLAAVTPGDLRYFAPPAPAAWRGRFAPSGTSAPKVAILMVHADMDMAIVEAMLGAEVQGLVVAGVGHGNAPRPVLDCLARAADDGLAVVRSSRIGAATVLRNTEVDDDAMGFITGGPLNPVKCRILLQLCLATPLRDRAGMQAVFELF